MKKPQSRKIIPRTYLFLTSIPVSITKIVYDWKMCKGDLGIFFGGAWISVLIMVVGVFFFIKFNTWSLWMNPEHEKPENAKF